MRSTPAGALRLSVETIARQVRQRKYWFQIQELISILFLCDFAELSSSFDFVFATSGTTDYSATERLHDDLTSISVAFWMKTDDKSNYGTVVSYANAQFNNAFVITDYNG